MISVHPISVQWSIDVDASSRSVRMTKPFRRQYLNNEVFLRMLSGLFRRLIDQARFNWLQCIWLVVDPAALPIRTFVRNAVRH